MKRLTCCLFVLIFVLIGCIRIPIKENPGVHKRGKTYDIGLVQLVNTGSTMITVYNLYLWPSYKIKHEYSFGHRLASLLTPDQEWVAYRTLGDNYILTSKDYAYPWLGIEIRPNGDIGNGRPWIDTRNNRRGRYKWEKWEVSGLQVFISLEGYPVKEKEGSFKAELIYSGITKNTIHITYREFIKNLARPAFYQELRYDLSESNLITFRSLKIKVLEADNSGIEFQVMDDAGLPWMPIP